MASYDRGDEVVERGTVPKFPHSSDSESSFEPSSGEEHAPPIFPPRDVVSKKNLIRTKSSRSSRVPKSTPAVGELTSLSFRGHHPVAEKASIHAEEQIRADAKVWASTFEPSGTVEHPLRSRSSTSQPASRKRASRSKKSRARKDAEERSKPNRLKGAYIDSYRCLVNKDIQDAAAQSIQGDHSQTLSNSQIGISIWTAFEKEQFFTALGRVGRHDAAAIAARVGTKSVLEVQYYLDLLQHALTDHHMNEPRVRLLNHADIPAAIQISEECCEVLGVAAEALSYRQDQRESKYEEREEGELWLLTEEISRELEWDLVENDGEPDTDGIMPAVTHLRLGNWLVLSERVFMNSGMSSGEDSWSTIADPGESIGIRATAFREFHDIFKNITRKLISATLEKATVRLRGNDRGGSGRARVVRRGDVARAVTSLGFKQNSKDFWQKSARRCQLDVYDVGNEYKIAEDAAPLDYDQVEAALDMDYQQWISRTLLTSAVAAEPQMRDTTSGSRATSVSKDAGIQSSQEQASSGSHEAGGQHSTAARVRNLAAEYMDTSQPSSKPTSDSSPEDAERRGKRETRALEAARQLELAQDQYTDLLDFRASLVEESQLWATVATEPPFTVDAAELPAPKRPAPVRRAGEELLDWRDRMLYVSAWESFETPVPETAFARNRRTRRRSSPSGDERVVKRPKRQGVQSAEFVLDSSGEEEEEGEEEEDDDEEDEDRRGNEEAMGVEDTEKHEGGEKIEEAAEEEEEEEE